MLDPRHNMGDVGEAGRVASSSAGPDEGADAILVPLVAQFADQWTTRVSEAYTLVGLQWTSAQLVFLIAGRLRVAVEYWQFHLLEHVRVARTCVYYPLLRQTAAQTKIQLYTQNTKIHSQNRT